MDGRLEVCTRNTFEMFNRIRGSMVAGRTDWQAIFQQDQGELPAVVLDIKISLLEIRGLLMTPGWRLVFADRTATVFLSDADADRLSLPKVNLPSALEEDLRHVESRISILKTGRMP